MGSANASGAAFDSNGNFYQAEPRGNRVTRINPDGSRVVVADQLNTPVGVQVDAANNLYVCNCGSGEILKFDSAGNRSVFAADADLMQCPNGLTMDTQGNLYAVTFSAGNVLKVTPGGDVSRLAELPTLPGGPNPVGLGHITWHDGNLFVTAIGIGVVYRMADDGSAGETLAGVPYAFSNTDGEAGEATFSKPNGIAISADGSKLFLNVSEPAWPSDATALHPASLRVITGF